MAEGEHSLSNEALLVAHRLNMLSIVFIDLILILRRIPVEDAMLKKHFGKDWNEWAKATPYRLIPGVL